MPKQDGYGPLGLSMAEWKEKMQQVKRLIRRSQDLDSEHLWSMGASREEACKLFHLGMRIVRCKGPHKAGTIMGFEAGWSNVPGLFVQWDDEPIVPAEDLPLVYIKNVKPEEKPDAED